MKTRLLSCFSDFFDICVFVFKAKTRDSRSHELTHYFT